MNSIFDYMVGSLQTYAVKTPNQVVSKKEYEEFCKEYVFLKLKGISFGKAFCERFNVSHFIIDSLPGDSAKGFIEKHGFVKK